MKIDGPKSLNNILLIGMTNRLDAIDEAVLRPGRLEMHMYIGLPTLNGREEIFQVHLKKIASNHKQTINVRELAEKTDNFTGAEVEACVKLAKSRAISRQVNPDNLTTAAFSDIVITQEDLVASVDEIVPKFGSKSAEFDIIISRGMGDCTEDMKDTLEKGPGSPNICFKFSMVIMPYFFV